jgi:hypothetical protein
MDFVSGLPKSEGKVVIMVVIDKLTKYSHLVALTHPFSDAVVVDKFLKIFHK